MIFLAIKDSLNIAIFVAYKAVQMYLLPVNFYDDTVEDLFPRKWRKDPTMRIIRWFSAFRRTDHAWRSLIWELEPHGERAAEWGGSEIRYYCTIFSGRPNNAFLRRFIHDAKRLNAFVCVRPRTDENTSGCDDRFDTSYDGPYGCPVTYYVGHDYRTSRPASWTQDDRDSLEVITYRLSHDNFVVRSCVGFLYSPHQVVRKFDTDVWSVRREGTDRLIATRPCNYSDHTECWVTGVPCAVVVTDTNHAWWRSVEKKVRALAAMKKLPIYALTRNPYGEDEFIRVN